MFRLFKHIANQYKFSSEFKEAILLSKLENPQTQKQALTKLLVLLNKQPANPYLRHQVLLLSEQLHTPIDLPEICSNVKLTR